MTRHLITYLSPHRLGICLLCKIAVHPGDGAETHFRNQHKIKGQKLYAIKILCQLWDIQSSNTVELPRLGSLPITMLLIHMGFKCNACMFYYGDKLLYASTIEKSMSKVAEKNGRRHPYKHLYSAALGFATGWWTILDQRAWDQMKYPNHDPLRMAHCLMRDPLPIGPSVRSISVSTYLMEVGS